MNESKADVAVETITEGGRSGKTTEDAVAVDWFPAPRPRILIDDMILNEEENQFLSDSLRLLLHEGGVADKATNLKSKIAQYAEIKNRIETMTSMSLFSLRNNQSLVPLSGIVDHLYHTICHITSTLFIFVWRTFPWSLFSGCLNRLKPATVG